MIIRSLLAVTLLAVSAHADFDRTVPASGNADLYVATGSGNVHIASGDDSQIHIKAHVYSHWNGGGDVQDRIRQINQNPPIRQSGNETHVGDVPAEDRRLYNNISIDYQITAPRNVAINVRTGSGDIEIDNLGRFLKAETGSGSVRAHGIGGPSDLHTGSGDIDLQQKATGEVRANTGSGSIRIDGLAGALNARTGSGDIEVKGTITGTSHLQSGSGSIRAHVGSDSHLNLNLSTGSGSISVSGNRPPHDDAHHFETAINGGGTALEAHTGSGDIEIN